MSSGLKDAQLIEVCLVMSSADFLPFRLYTFWHTCKIKNFYQIYLKYEFIKNQIVFVVRNFEQVHFVFGYSI